MGHFLVTILIAAVAMLLSLAVSTKTGGWFTWSAFAAWSPFIVYKGFALHNVFRKGTSLSAGDIVAMASCPFVGSVTIGACLLLLVVPLSKLHLLWFYPVVGLTFDFTIGARAVKKLESARDSSS